MKKIILFIIILSMIIHLNDSFKIATPEELLASPTLNEEKRNMKEAVDNFKPVNSTSYPVTVSGNDKTMSMIISDMDSDSSSEIISFYKSKIDDKIGMFILKKIDSVWIKKADIKFNTYEISEMAIEDLKGDGSKQLIIKAYETENKLNTRNYSIVYFKDKEVEVIKEIPNIIIKIADINSDNQKEIFSITRNTLTSEYVLNTDIFFDDKIISYAKKTLNNIKNPYNISVGNIFDNQKAVFIDYIGDNKYENTNILLFDEKNKTLTNMNDIEAFSNKAYQFNVQSKDIDSDGIIEVCYKFKAPNYSMLAQDFGEEALITGYFKIKSDYSLELVKEIYEDKSLGYVINIPKIFTGKYTINKNKDMETTLNYINYLGKEYPIIQISYIKKYQWQQDTNLRNSMQLITENQEYVVAGKVVDYSESLNEEDKKNYLNMRSAVKILSNVISEKIY